MPKKELDKEKRFINSQINKVVKQQQKKMRLLQKYENYYFKSLYDTSGTIGVIDTVHPGVIIRIGNRKHMVRDALKRCLFYVDNDRIMFSALTR